MKGAIPPGTGQSLSPSPSQIRIRVRVRNSMLHGDSDWAFNTRFNNKLPGRGPGGVGCGSPRAGPPVAMPVSDRTATE